MGSSAGVSRQDISVRGHLAVVALCVAVGLFGLVGYVIGAVTLTNVVVNSVGLSIVAGLNVRSAQRKRK
jgi:hypothetical protein